MNSIVRLVLAMVVSLGWLVLPSAAQQCCTGNVTTYCTAGTAVQGCVPQIEGVGRPSVDSASGFSVRVTQLPGERYGTVFYGFTTAAQPWTGTSSSYLCVAAPVQRMGTQDGGGTVGACNGVLQLDFNAWIATHPTALGAPLTAGQVVRAQGWYRDPSAPGQTNLSNALQYALCSGVGDTTPPVITTCAANQTVAANANCQAVVPNFTASVVASDNCTSVVLTQSPTAGASVSLGATAVTITARDAAGNTSQCAATLTVTDTSGPVITTCAANQAVAANSNCQGVVPDFTAGVVASDSCGGGVTLSQAPAAGTITTSGLSSTVVTITATDLAGNTSTCASTLTVTLSGACQTPAGFVAIQPGTFQMGDGGFATSIHTVTISYSFWMSATEVTRVQYAALMGTNPSFYGGSANRPVDGVTWFNARAYCAALTAQQAGLGIVPAGYEYRLPTEAEWEYACRAGTTTIYNVGNALWCFPNAASANIQHCEGGTLPPGTCCPPNAWGLYDMHGNVWEWCLDSYAPYPSNPETDPFVTGGLLRIIRGGSWNEGALTCRSAGRNNLNPYDNALFNGDYYDGIGFRVVLAPVLVP
jgi:formylglycine-generating enzyme required for sulfatase activity